MNFNVSEKDILYQAERRRDFERQAEQHRLARQAQPESQQEANKQPLLQKTLVLITNLLNLPIR